MKPLPSSSVFISISTIFIIPTARLPSSVVTGGLYAASIWVGISSADKSSHILQAGIYTDVTLGKGGSQQATYSAWWEWLPAASTDITSNEFLVKPGDKLEVIVLLASPTSGSVVLENLSTGQISQKNVVPSNIKGSGLLGMRAEWIVESYSGRLELPDFGTVEFTECKFQHLKELIWIELGKGILLIPRFCV
jgi:hypothetical protein